MGYYRASTVRVSRAAAVVLLFVEAAWIWIPAASFRLIRSAHCAGQPGPSHSYRSGANLTLFK